MLYDQGFPLNLWEKTCNTLVYLHNCIPHLILGKITLEQNFSGIKLDVSHFENFGVFVYYHVSKESKNKLESTIELGEFLGYIETPHKYYVYFLSLRVIDFQRDVKFDEEKEMWFSLEREI